MSANIYLLPDGCLTVKRVRFLLHTISKWVIVSITRNCFEFVEKSRKWFARNANHRFAIVPWKLHIKISKKKSYIHFNRSEYYSDIRGADTELYPHSKIKKYVLKELPMTRNTTLCITLGRLEELAECLKVVISRLTSLDKFVSQMFITL